MFFRSCCAILMVGLLNASPPLRHAGLCLCRAAHLPHIPKIGKAPARERWPGSPLPPGLDTVSCHRESWLHSRPAGSAADDLTFSEHELCVDSSWASFALLERSALLWRRRRRPSGKVPAFLWHWLAAFASCTAIRPHLAIAIRHPASVICHSASGICIFSCPIPRSEFRIPD